MNYNQMLEAMASNYEKNLLERVKKEIFTQDEIGLSKIMLILSQDGFKKVEAYEYILKSFYEIMPEGLEEDLYEDFFFIVKSKKTYVFRNI